MADDAPVCMDCYRVADKKCGECGVGYCDQHLKVDKDGDSELRLCSRCRYKHYKERMKSNG